jgi:hypothetical protein
VACPVAAKVRPCVEHAVRWSGGAAAPLCPERSPVAGLAAAELTTVRLTAPEPAAAKRWACDCGQTLSVEVGEVPDYL